MIAPKIVRPVPGDAPAAPTVHHQLGAPSQTHVYREYGDGLDPDEIGRVLRFDSANGRKEFRPLTLWKVGERLEWRWESWPSPRPLYGLDLLADRRDVPVLVVEGEKTADAAAKLFPDFVAITSPGGSGVAGKADWSPLKGRRVVIWPDSDEPGAKYAADVATRLHEIGAASVAIVTLPQGLPKGWDLADPLPKDFNPKSLRESLDNAAPVAAGNPPETTDQAAARLARLSRLEYDRVRKAEATSLGVRLESLDKEVSRLRGDGQGTAPGVGRPLSFAAPESWAHAVDGKALLDGIRATFTRYVALPDHADVALALWVMHTYVVDACRITPRLAILSPEKRCGKTTLLSILEALVCKPCPATLISAPALFRTVEAARPTFLIDEADTFVRDNGDLRNVVNSGYRRFGVTVKTAGEYHEPRQFSTFGPVALAAIGKLPDTIMDRSVAIPMRRRGVGESVESWREFKADSLAIFARQAARWADDNCAMLGNVNPIAPSALNDRAADNWYILFAIADRCGGDWPERAREAALALAANAEDDATSLRTLLLADIRDILIDLGNPPKMKSNDLVEHLNGLTDRPWPDVRRGKGLNANDLARRLMPYGVRPSSQRSGAETFKGYGAKDFEDAFNRYLPALAPSRRHNPCPAYDPADSGAVTGDPVSRPEMSGDPNTGAGCDGVTAEREERAAILEFEAHMPRAEAEIHAALDL